MSHQGVAETDIGALDIADESIAERRAGAGAGLEADTPAWKKALILWIERTMVLTGRLLSLLLIPLTGVILYEVLSRKTFFSKFETFLDANRVILVTVTVLFFAGSFYLSQSAKKSAALNNRGNRTGPGQKTGLVPQESPAAAMATILKWLGIIMVCIIALLLFSKFMNPWFVKWHIFQQPTLWSLDVSKWIAGFMFMAASAYALTMGVHIRADFIYRNWTRFTQMTVDGWLYIIFFFPGIILFYQAVAKYAEKAWISQERAMVEASSGYIVAPVLTSLPLAAMLLMFQGVAELLRCSHLVRGRQNYVFTAFAVLFLVIGVLALFDFLQIVFEQILPTYLGGFSLINSLAGAAGVLSVFGDGFNFAANSLSDALASLRGLGGVHKVNVGAVMIGVMLFAIFIGFPISFTLIFLATLFGAWGVGTGSVFFLETLWFSSTVQSDELRAVPLFVLMGILMEQSGVMQRLFTSIKLLFSRLDGALFVAVLLVSTVFAAATGIVGASVTILGIMAAKSMTDSGYDVRLSAGAITAGGTLGILIPPSIMLVVMGPTLEIPVTDLFSAAIVPGIMLATLYIGYTLLRTYFDPSLGPRMSKEETDVPVFYVFKEFFLGLVPPTVLITATLGSILMGVATPTEAAACGVLGAVILMLFYGKVNLFELGGSLVKTLEITVLIMFLVAASNFFGATFSLLGTPVAITNYLLTLDMPVWAMLALIMVVIFLLGWPLEWVPIVVIIVPIVVPLLESMGVDLLLFAILVAVNLQTAWLSPPVALSAYFLKAVAPDWDLKDIYFGMMQFMCIQLVGLILIFIFPGIATWLPANKELGGQIALWVLLAAFILLIVLGVNMYFKSRQKAVA